MSHEQKVHVGDVGTRFEITITNFGIAYDISAATLITLRLEKPDGTTINKTAVFESDGTNGVVLYTLEAGVIDTDGEWKYQVYLTFPTGGWWSEQGTFEVYPVITAPV